MQNIFQGPAGERGGPGETGREGPAVSEPFTLKLPSAFSLYEFT